MSTTAGMIGGVQSTLGSQAPKASGSPTQSDATMLSTLLHANTGVHVAPNFVHAGGLLTIPRTITNTTGATVTAAKVRITGLSEANGLPEPGVSTQPGGLAPGAKVNIAFTFNVITLSTYWFGYNVEAK